MPKARNQGRGNTDGAYSCEAIDMTGGDVLLETWSVALEVDAAGSVEMVFADDTVAVTRPFETGIERPFQVKELKAAGTDADTVYVYR